MAGFPVDIQLSVQIGVSLAAGVSVLTTTRDGGKMICFSAITTEDGVVVVFWHPVRKNKRE